MIWCLITCAACCTGLSLAALIARPPQIRITRGTLRHWLRGCLATTLLLIAGLCVVLAVMTLG
jgi:hypothetical protein